MSIDLSFLQQLKVDYTNYPMFIESNTFNGNTILAMEPYFKSLITIVPEFYNYTIIKNKYSGDKIQFDLGNSDFMFKHILPAMNMNIIFWLDCFYNDQSTNSNPLINQSTNATSTCDLIREITTIYQTFKHIGIIMIDDYKMFGKGPTSTCNVNWSNINMTDILAILQPRISDSYTIDSPDGTTGRYIIHINSIA